MDSSRWNDGTAQVQAGVLSMTFMLEAQQTADSANDADAQHEIGRDKILKTARNTHPELIDPSSLPGGGCWRHKSILHDEHEQVEQFRSSRDI